MGVNTSKLLIMIFALVPLNRYLTHFDNTTQSSMFWPFLVLHVCYRLYRFIGIGVGGIDDRIRLVVYQGANGLMLWVLHHQRCIIILMWL